MKLLTPLFLLIAAPAMALPLPRYLHYYGDFSPGAQAAGFGGQNWADYYNPDEAPNNQRIQETYIFITLNQTLRQNPKAATVFFGLSLDEYGDLYRKTLALRREERRLNRAALTAIPCATPATSTGDCSTFTVEAYEESLQERMSISKLAIMLEAYRGGVEAALATCKGPWERCTGVRSSYNPSTGELIIPALDYQGYPWTSGISAKLQLDSEDPPTFIVTEVD